MYCGLRATQFYYTQVDSPVLWATQFYYTQVDSSVLRVAVWRCIVHWYSEVAVLLGGEG